MAKNGLILARPSGGVLATDCGGGCSGDDPLCSYCHCSARLSTIYMVTFTGFPNKKGLATFNGTWPLAWTFDCLWVYDITSYHRLGLHATAEGGWSLSCAIYGGTSVTWGGYGTTFCTPDAYTWIVSECYETPFNPACPEIRANATAVVAREQIRPPPGGFAYP